MPIGAALRPHMLQLAKGWKFDPVRPTLQLSTFLTALAAHPKLTPSAVRATQALCDNVAQHKWPVTTTVTRPASMPEYYDRLIEGFEKSTRGIGRPWWKVFFGVW